MLALKVTGMTCDGCVKSVQRVVGRVPGVEGVTVDLAHGDVNVSGEPDREAVVQAITKAGYAVAPA